MEVIITSLNLSSDKQFTTILVKNDALKSLFLVPKELVTKKIRQLSEDIIHGNSSYFEERLLCQQYFGVGIDNHFTSLDLIKNKKNIEEYKEAIISTPIFEEFKVESVVLKPNSDFLNITLDGET